MGNDLRERLEALSAGATQGEWRNVEAHPAYIRADAGLTITGNGYRRSDAALNAKLCMTLVNAFRSGDLVTRSEMEEAVAKEREACAELAASFMHNRLYKNDFPVCSYHSREIGDSIRARALLLATLEDLIAREE